jgi:hypothetical protein
MLKSAILVAAGLGLAATPLQDRRTDHARVLLDEAIVAAGGREALARYKAFAWLGTATIYAGNRTIRIEGEWQIEPPEKSRVQTFEVDKGPGSMRTMTIDGNRGWSAAAGKEQVLPDAMLANERDQFYLYYVLRLEPLTRDGSTLTLIDPDADGNPGIRVARAGRRDVDMFFDKASHRVVRQVTKVVDPASGREVVEELRFAGTIESGGVRWFRDLTILQDRAPFFALTLTTFTALQQLDLSR